MLLGLEIKQGAYTGFRALAVTLCLHPQSLQVENYAKKKKIKEGHLPSLPLEVKAGMTNIFWNEMKPTEGMT